VLTKRLVADLYVHGRGQLFALRRAQTAGSNPTIITFREGTYNLPEINPCIDDTWTPISLINVPSARVNHTAVWSGSEMIVWGGQGTSFLNTGGRYNPNTDTWMATSTTNAPDARSGHTAVSTGSEMIVWGGGANGTYFNTGGRYNPNTDTWTSTSITNAPDTRF